VLRLTSPEGLPLSDVRTSAAPPSPEWVVPRAASYSGPLPASLLHVLSERAQHTSAKDPAARSQALLDLGAYLHYFQPQDTE
jgi:hypothetical protein